MAIDNQILTQTWEDQPKENVEDGLKALLTAILAALDEPAAEGSVGLAALTQQLRDLVNNAVPNTRTVNNKPLSENVTLGASDVGAMPANAVVVKRITVNGDEVENNNGTVALVIEGGGTADLSQVFGKVEYNSNTKRINFYAPDAVIGTDAPIGYIDASALVNPTMDSAPTAGNTTHTVSSDGVAAAIAAALAQAGGQVTVTTNGDGTFTIHAADDYTINLNHTHPNMAKLVVCEESDLPSTLDPATIYGVNEDGEIAMLYVGGIPFYGGGGAAPGEPAITKPSGSTINLGENSGSSVSAQVKIQGRNLTGDLTVTVGTGLTISYGSTTAASSVTIPLADALVGAMVTIAYAGTGALDDGTLSITGGGASAKTVTVVVTEQVVQLAAVKFTKQQFIQTAIIPGPNTKLEIDMQLGNLATTNSSSSGMYLFISPSDTNYSPNKVFYANTATYEQMDGDGNWTFYLWIEEPWLNNSSPSYALRMNRTEFTTRSILILDMPNQSGSFRGVSVTLPQKTTTMPQPLKFGCGATGAENVFRLADITLYSIKHYESGVLTHEYLPQQRGGVVGLYDSVTDTFISSGTSTSLVAIQNS